MSQLLPAIPMVPINNEEDHLFFETPRIFLDVWIEVVVPALTALFGLLSWDLCCNLLPAFCSLLLDEVSKPCVFLDCPRALNISDKIRFEKVAPSV